MSHAGPYGPSSETDSVHAPLHDKQHAPIAVQPVGAQPTVWGASGPHGSYDTVHQQAPAKEISLPVTTAYAAPVHPGGAVIPDPAQVLLSIQGGSSQRRGRHAGANAPHCGVFRGHGQTADRARGGADRV